MLKFNAEWGSDPDVDEEKKASKDLGLDAINFSAIKKEKRKYKSHESFRGSQAKLAKSKPSVMIFIRMGDNETFMSIPLRHKTVKYLLDAIQMKNPSFMPYSIGHVYQTNSKGLKFLLDDDMMEYLENQQIFSLELTPSSKPDKKFDITLKEQTNMIDS